MSGYNQVEELGTQWSSHHAKLNLLELFDITRVYCDDHRLAVHRINFQGSVVRQQLIRVFGVAPAATVEQCRVCAAEQTFARCKELFAQGREAVAWLRARGFADHDVRAVCRNLSAELVQLLLLPPECRVEVYVHARRSRDHPDAAAAMQITSIPVQALDGTLWGVDTSALADFTVDEVASALRRSVSALAGKRFTVHLGEAATVLDAVVARSDLYLHYK